VKTGLKLLAGTILAAGALVPSADIASADTYHNSTGHPTKAVCESRRSSLSGLGYSTTVCKWGGPEPWNRWWFGYWK
jgi:hypothetical protein